VADLIDEYTVTDVYVKIKFGVTVKVSTIINANFTLNNTDATPSAIANPFRAISLVRDYNSISRILYLYFSDGVLQNDTNYRFTAQNLTDVLDNSIPSQYFDFATQTLNVDITTTPEYIYPEPVIVDHAISDSIFSVPLNNSNNTTILGFISSYPENDSYYLFEDENNGRIELMFNFSPLSAYLVSPHIKVQKREIKKAPSRWIDVNAQITLDGSDPIVYVDLPSVDHYPDAATPSTTTVYNQSGYTYFENNYKYRILLSKTLTGLNEDSTPTEHAMISDIELIYCGVLDPMYIDVDEIASSYPDATKVEISENIHFFSQEVYKLLGLTEEPTEMPFVAIEYIKAATACSLDKIYSVGSGFGNSFTLGDLTVNRPKSGAKTLNRGNANSWCELSSVLRAELLSSTSRGGFRSVVKGSKYENPIPVRKIRDIDATDTIAYNVARIQDNLDVKL